MDVVHDCLSCGYVVKKKNQVIDYYFLIIIHSGGGGLSLIKHVCGILFGQD
jgi:hypothetical protein